MLLLAALAVPAAASATAPSVVTLWICRMFFVGLLMPTLLVADEPTATESKVSLSGMTLTTVGIAEEANTNTTVTICAIFNVIFLSNE